DLFSDGSAAIHDYKTGSRVPGHNEVKALLNPQLPLEAAMLRKRGFPDLTASHVRELIYLQLRGGEPAGMERVLKLHPDTVSEQAVAKLVAYIALFDSADQPYFSRLIPHSVTDVGDYDHLARVREWQVIGDEDI